MDKKNMYATLGKPSELQELYSAVVYYNIKRVYVTIIEGKGRINKNNINLFFKQYIPLVELNYLDYDFSRTDWKHYSLFLLENSSFIDYFALSLYRNRSIYKVSPILKKQGKKIIHLSDGVSNAFSLFGFLLGTKTKNLTTFLKGIIVYFEHKRAKADVCFFLLYPLKCSFSKTTLPIKEIHDKPKDIDLVNNAEMLIVGGWGMDTEDIVKYLNIKDSFCATSKNLQINVNGLTYPLKSYITAEDIINYVSINRIVGTPSTALIYAKCKNPQLKVDCILTGVLNKTYGIFYEREYVKLGKTLGINFLRK